MPLFVCCVTFVVISVSLSLFCITQFSGFFASLSGYFCPFVILFVGIFCQRQCYVLVVVMGDCSSFMPRLFMSPLHSFWHLFGYCKSQGGGFMSLGNQLLVSLFIPLISTFRTKNRPLHVVYLLLVTLCIYLFSLTLCCD